MHRITLEKFDPVWREDYKPCNSCDGFKDECIAYMSKAMYELQCVNANIVGIPLGIRYKK